MIETPPQFRSLVSELNSATWTVAAIGVLLESGLGAALVEPRDLDELAATCPTLSRRRIAAVLDCCAVHGVVTVDGARYQLAPGVVPTVTTPMRMTLVADIRSQILQPLAMLNGAPSGWRHTDADILQTQGDASTVLPAMLKTQLAPHIGDLVAQLERPGARMLDVGTGVGSLAIAACRTFPQLSVVGVDGAEAPLALARENVARAGLADRIELRRVLIEELRDEAEYTLAWLPGFFITDLPAALARVAASLRPDGWLLFGTGGTGADAKHAAMWALLMDAWGGQRLMPAEAEALVRDAGLREVRVLPSPPGGPLLVVGQR